MDIRRAYVLALFLGSLGDTFGSAALADDARVHIVSPIEGQQFAPGDKVSIVVDVAPSLRATDGRVGLAGLGSVKWKGFSGTRFTADFVIPDSFAGPLVLWPDVWAGHTVLGPKVRIKVRPLTPPKQLRVLNYYYYLSLPRTYPEHLSVVPIFDYGTTDQQGSVMSGDGTMLGVATPGRVTLWRLVNDHDTCG